MEKTYTPAPVCTKDVALPPALLALGELLAENAHEVWAAQRISQGWAYGPRRDDSAKETPCLVPYQELPEGEKVYDRQTALETLRLIVKLGWQLIPPEEKK